MADSPKRPNSSRSPPSSSSWCTSGLRFRLPSTASASTPFVIVNVSYCATKGGNPPAVPYDARSFSSLTCGSGHHGSRITSQLPETRPNVCHRFPAPYSELPSRRTSPSRT